MPARLRLLAAACFTLLPLALRAADGPPPAPVREVRDVYFGKVIVDPYRWMEDEKSPELAAWARGQASYARARLDALPGRAALLDRLRELDRAGVRIGQVQRYGGRLVYLKGEPGDEIRKLYVRDAAGGTERLLVDPQQFGAAGTHAAIDFFQTSWDGRYVGFGSSQGGSEQSTIRVVEVATGKLLPDAIDRCLYSYVTWHPDGRSFFYLRQNPPAPGEAEADRLKRMRSYRHVLGSDPARDEPVFGHGLSAAASFADADFPVVVYSPASSWIFGLAVHGVQNELTLYAAPLARLSGRATPWRKLVDVPDAVTGFDVRGDELYLLTHRGAPRFRILATSVKRPDLGRARVVVPEGPGVLTAMAVAQDGLYYQEMAGGPSHLWRAPLGGAAPAKLPLPFEGALFGLFADSRQPGALVLSTGWTHPPRWLAWDARAGQAVDTGLIPPWPVDFSGVEALEVTARSADGTEVPLSILRKKGLSLDGSHPALLDGYGAYGISIEPGFDPLTLAWLERGGVLAFAHVRGGGDRGEDWHRAGQKATKMNTVADFIACAEYLVAQGYTTSARLAGTGTSAGGILIGRAITERPELFAAALSRVGVSNALRMETTQGGPANIPEFGTATTPEGFLALHMMDAFHHVRAGVAYPAVLVTTGLHDPRVPFWQPAKLAARLQAMSASGRPVLLRVDEDAGHGMGSTRSQLVAQRADEWAFLLWQMGDPAFQPRSGP